MKKIVAAVCTAMLVVSTAVTAFAAGSTYGTSSVTGGQGTAADGSDVSIVVESIHEEDRGVVDALVADGGLEDVLGSAFQDGMQIVDVRDVDILGDASLVEFPVTITFQVNGVKAGDVVYVLHYNGTEWEAIQGTAGEGTITATFESLSPVAFVVKSAAADSGDDTQKPADTQKPGTTTPSTGSTGTGSSASTGSTGAGSSTTSPKTGETSAMMVVALVAVAALGGMAYAKKANA